MGWHRLAAVAVVGIAATVGVQPTAAWAQGRPAAVGVDEVRFVESEQTVPVVGRLVALRTGTVNARVAGPVNEVLVEVGDRVEQDQLIARLDSARLRRTSAVRQAAIGQARASLNTAEASRRLSQQQLDRIDGLRGSAAFTQGRFDDLREELARADADVAVARSALVQAEAELAEIALEISRTEVRAPYPGVVAGRMVEVGEYVNEGAPLIELVDDTELEAEAPVPTVRLVGVAAGLAVKVQLDDGTVHDGTVRAIVPRENANTRTRPVRVAMTFGDVRKPLAHEQAVTVQLPLGGGGSLLTVHKDAVLTQRGARVVFLVEQGTAQPRTVTLGEAIGSRFVVVEGLAPGDVVVVRGNERLRPGQRVEPMPANGEG